MLLHEAYEQCFVGSMLPDDLLKVLRDESSVSVKSVKNGLILLSNGQVLKCVREYYKVPGTTTKAKKLINPILSCRLTRRDLGIQGSVGDLQCRNCHVSCISLEESHNLEYR